MESDFRPLNPCLTVLPRASVLKPVRNPTIAANQLRLWACNRGACCFGTGDRIDVVTPFEDRAVPHRDHAMAGSSKRLPVVSTVPHVVVSTTITLETLGYSL